MAQTIQIEKLSPHLGAEIRGIDLAQPLTPETFEAIHGALMENLVIFFRDQHITMEQQKSFGCQFGELHVHPASKGPEGHPEVFIIEADENSKMVAGNGWHSDVTADETPPLGSILYLTEVPEVGGDTIFASMYAAYETLSEPLKALLSGFTAFHTSERIYRGRYGLNQHHRDQSNQYPSAEHPVIRTHPVTGKKALFVNESFTSHIRGIPRKESDALLNFLYEHIQTLEFQCRFRWQKNSIAFWDNRCVQHHALWDYYPAKRYGTRVTVKGDRPF